MLCQLHAEEIDKIFFLKSVLQDDFYSTEFSTLKEYEDYITEVYEHMEIVKSEIIEGEFNQKDLVFYEVQLYKIKLHNYTWVLLRFQNPDKSNGWYRISGYKESDFVHFYNRVLCNYLRNKKIASVLEEWNQKISSTVSVDFNCLIAAVKSSRKRHNSECMISNSLSLHRSRIMISGGDVYKETYLEYQMLNDLHSTWSQRLYKGEYP